MERQDAKVQQDLANSQSAESRLDIAAAEKAAADAGEDASEIERAVACLFPNACDGAANVASERDSLEDQIMFTTCASAPTLPESLCAFRTFILDSA